MPRAPRSRTGAVGQGNGRDPGARGRGIRAVTVLWKVVSSDGHPISGELAFTVTAPRRPPDTDSDSDRHRHAAARRRPQDATPAPSETPAPCDDGDAALPWILFALLGVAVLGGAVIYLLVSRASRAEGARRAAGCEGAGGAPAARRPIPPPADR